MVVEISDWNDLDNVRNDLTGDYVLVNDLDKDTAGYTGIGDDFEPIGFIANDNYTSEFEGSFDGDGFAISDVVIEYDGEEDIGLFASTDYGSLIENLSVDGSVTVTTGGRYYGGLVGVQAGGTIQNCVSHVDVTALDGERVGGLVGRIDDTVTDSYATGSVEGDDRVGGLVGNNRATIQTSYAVGLVTGNTRVGALVGQNEFNDELSDSYADEETTGQTDLTGDGLGSITNSYTLTTAEMQGSEAETNMDGFDFANVWETVEEGD